MPASSTSFTKTETLRRLRIARKLILSQDHGLARNGRAEVGTRIDKVSFPTVEEAFEYNRTEDNDLEDSADFNWAASMPEVQAHGYIANIYLYEPEASGGFLDDVQNVWLGTPDHEPVLFHRTRGLITTEVLS